MLMVVVECYNGVGTGFCGDIEQKLSLTGVREGLKKAVAFELNLREHKEITKWKISEE